MEEQGALVVWACGMGTEGGCGRAEGFGIGGMSHVDSDSGRLWRVRGPGSLGVSYCLSVGIAVPCEGWDKADGLRVWGLQRVCQEIAWAVWQQGLRI